MYKVGIDIMEVSRVEKAIKRNKRFSDKIFTEYEKSHIDKKAGSASACGIFSSKEAVSKLLGTGIRGFSWKDIEISHDSYGKPIAALHNNAKKTADKLGITDIELSISHTQQNVVSVAIGQVLKVSNFTEFEVRIPKRKIDSHKGDYGKVGIIAGSTGMTGAAYMSSLSSLRCGSGLVYSFVPEQISEIMQIKSIENIVVPADDEQKGFFTKVSFKSIKERISSLDAAAVGPGLGRNAETTVFLDSLLRAFKKPLVIDADGIHHLKNLKEKLLSENHNIVITPHNAEFAKFLGVKVEELLKQKEHYAVEAAKRYKVTVVLKGHDTIVTDGERLYRNNTGNPGMATAGSGDVLTGIIASLLGQGLDSFEASKAGVYIHGFSGDITAEKKGEYGMIARDIIENIPEVLKQIVQ